ncbi:hypothetical protein C7M84_019023 [Penaeus vannamei]|uniref:Uncharacterized protein n=1 Tax=Penaeus vannamei TaxID=6689 RepID=A0A423SFX0_PENVA|nr:hypothetical protein C7M84_019023 [Penaeus vannamei]
MSTMQESFQRHQAPNPYPQKDTRTTPANTSDQNSSGTQATRTDSQHDPERRRPRGDLYRNAVDPVAISTRRRRPPWQSSTPWQCLPERRRPWRTPRPRGNPRRPRGDLSPNAVDPRGDSPRTPSTPWQSLRPRGDLSRTPSTPWRSLPERLDPVAIPVDPRGDLSPNAVDPVAMSPRTPSTPWQSPSTPWRSLPEPCPRPRGNPLRPPWRSLPERRRPRGDLSPNAVDPVAIPFDPRGDLSPNAVDPVAISPRTPRPRGNPLDPVAISPRSSTPWRSLPERRRPRGNPLRPPISPRRRRPRGKRLVAIVTPWRSLPERRRPRGNVSRTPSTPWQSPSTPVAILSRPRGNVSPNASTPWQSLRPPWRSLPSPSRNENTRAECIGVHREEQRRRVMHTTRFPELGNGRRPENCGSGLLSLAAVSRSLRARDGVMGQRSG